MSGALKVNDETFEAEVLKAATPVLVDFWAEWCGPCKMIAPVIDEVAAEMAGKVKVVKVSVDEAPELATKYGIMSIPTLMLFKDGKVAAQMVGAMGKAQLLDKIKSAI